MDATRRTLMGGATAAIGLRFMPLVQAQDKAPLQVFAHRVMKTVAAGSAGDVTAAFAKASGVAVEWTTFDTGPLQERLFREASLTDSAVDVGFILNTQAVPRIANLFESLGPYLAKQPVDAPDDIFPGLISGMTV